MNRLRAFASIVKGLLRELADENAYRRHLEKNGCPHSAAEWRRFSEARLRTRYGNPKCC
ncbi:MAG: hypothetical protein U0Q18_22510 [Bryobacteraceae bacterium]